MNTNISVIKSNNKIEFFTREQFIEKVLNGERYEIVVIATTGHIVVTPVE